MKEQELFEVLKNDIQIIVYMDGIWKIQTFYGNIFTGDTYIEVLENANNYAKDFNGFG